MTTEPIRDLFVSIPIVEFEHLHAEVKRLRTMPGAGVEESLLARIQELRTQNERLRAALEECQSQSG